MDKYQLSQKLKNSKRIDKYQFILHSCRGKDVLDMGCVRHSADYSLRDKNWLHKGILSVAKEVVGIDYLPSEIQKLNAVGYKNIIFGDVCKPLNISKQFDVIVAGDLIAHLINFECFFDNCTRLLKPGAILIITTPNPFFTGEFHYTAFKKQFLLNPEQTCWIDPLALSQLAKRFGYIIDQIYFIKHTWQLKYIICETKNHQYDILNGVWLNITFGLRIITKLSGMLFDLFYLPYKILTGTHSSLVRYCDYLAVLRNLNNL